MSSSVAEGQSIIVPPHVKPSRRSENDTRIARGVQGKVNRKPHAEAVGLNEKTPANQGLVRRDQEGGCAGGFERVGTNQKKSAILVLGRRSLA
jgi:hypothetical protein